MTVYQGEKFQKYLTAQGISAARAAEILGVTRQAVYKFFKTANLEATTVYNIVNKLGVDEAEIWQPNVRLEALPTRLYADPLDYDDRNQKIVHLPDGTIAMRVPIVPARAYAGYMRGFADPQAYDDLEDILIGVDKEPGGTYLGFEVVGDSMICLDTVDLADESIFPGRIAIGRELSQDHWRTRLHTHNYRNWIFVHKTEGILIKQIAEHNTEAGTVTIHSLNPKYKDEVLKLEDMQQIFSVIQIVQKTRAKLK